MRKRGILSGIRARVRRDRDGGSPGPGPGSGRGVRTRCQPAAGNFRVDWTDGRTALGERVWTDGSGVWTDVSGFMSEPQLD